MRTDPRHWLVVMSVVVLASCGPAKNRPTSPAPPAVAAPAPEARPARTPDASPTEPPCPAIDYAALEPQPEPVDPRTIALSRVFVREEVRKGRATPRRVSLGDVRIPVRGPAPKLGVGFGLGWMGLQRSWVDGTLRPRVQKPFATWLAAREQLGAHQRGRYLLDVRVRYAMSVEPPEAWGDLRCIERAAAQAERDEDEAEAATKAAARTLREVLEGLPSPSGGEKLLLAYLIAQTLPHPHRPEDTARPRRLLSEVVEDTRLPREQRARAAEQMAALSSTDSDDFVEALQTTLALTRDPELTVETLVKLADARDGDALAEARRVEIVALLDTHDPESWRIAETLAALADARLERGAFASARDDAARCARTTTADLLADDPDPWGCAPILAEAIVELAEAPEDVEIPHAFLGPLALATMHAALARFDRDQARHAGELLLAERPEAAEAPEALALLAALARTEDERTAQLDRREREYGLHSAWAVAQRRRLAWEHEPQQVESYLARLLDVSRVRVPTEPSTPAQHQAELRARAELVAEACEPPRVGGRTTADVRVDTTGATPVVTVRRADRELTRCLRRAARSRFRSVGAVRVSFRVVYE